MRWRVINSFARVMAVEKPMQYSVPWTSLSMVFGIAITGMPAAESAAEKLSVSSPPIVTRQPMPRRSRFSSTIGREIVILAVERQLLDAIGTECVLEAWLRGHFARIGARRVQDGAAGAVDGARVVARERANIDGILVGVGHVGQSFPPLANADDLAAHFFRAIDDGLDHRDSSPGTSPPPVRIPILFFAATK